MNTIAADTTIVLARELRPVVRNPFSVIFTLVQPLVFLGLFAPLLDQVSGFDDTGDALQWFVPGIIVMSALFGASTTGSNLQLEMQTGSHERLLVTPLHRSSLLLGRALKEVVPMLLQGALIVAVVLPFGFDLHPAGALLGLAMVSVFAVGLGALSHALAIASRGNEWMFWGVQQTLLFPLLLLSGMLLPVDGGPGWMEALSKVNPLTHVVEAERALFAGAVYEPVVAYGAVAALAVAAVGLWVGIKAVASETG